MSCFSRCFSSKNQSILDEDHTALPIEATKSSLRSGESNGNSEQDPILNEIRIHADSIILLNKVDKASSGKYFSVWDGKYKNATVVLKRLASEHSNNEKYQKAFRDEIKLLASLQHPRIIELIGITWTSVQNLSIIIEFMNCGELYGLLHSEMSLTWDTHVLQVAIDIARALDYLHQQSPIVIHRDLTSKSISVDSRKGSKISDFSFSRNLSYEETMTAGIGTSRYMSPEVIIGEEYDERVDIYSFGIILNEMDTRQIPFVDAKGKGGRPLPEVAMAHAISTGSIRPQFSKKVPSSILKLAQACLQHDPSLRPSAKQLLQNLEGFCFHQINKGSDVPSYA